MKSILITGCSTGLGRATALLFSNKGYQVFAGVRNDKDAQALTESDSAGNIQPLLLDITDGEQLGAAVERLENQLADTGLDALVNNAGIAKFIPLEFANPDDIRHMFEVNTMGPLLLSQSLLPLLRKAKGRIVIVGSIAGKVAFRFNGPYSISKFALEGFTDVLRRELSPFGIRVCLLEPGAIATPMMDKVEAESEEVISNLPREGKTYYESAIRDYMSSIPFSKDYAATPEQAAKVVAHAVESRRPKPRYLVTPDAKALVFLSWVLPDRIFDALLNKLSDLMGSEIMQSKIWGRDRISDQT
ncbi:MAG: short-chain dehydrogenase/reductase [Gammaproteobacteria bacterium]|jgi:NAD(P)-dependent dehydrogenase (short-subunit alcohol dehydrogenase family)|nr:short-chain dehydrogenase/reductase [Gammaproteobacteria bacterium]|tara:strand:- start:962 stop:1867 length:906 start_codon:yes stop_codon:yes gene_type:complete